MTEWEKANQYWLNTVHITIDPYTYLAVKYFIQKVLEEWLDQE